MNSFPVVGTHELTAISDDGRFGLYAADRFGKRGPAAMTAHYVYDREAGKGYNAKTTAHVRAWVAFQRDGSKCAPWFGGSDKKAPPVTWNRVSN